MSLEGRIYTFLNDISLRKCVGTRFSIFNWLATSGSDCSLHRSRSPLIFVCSFESSANMFSLPCFLTLEISFINAVKRSGPNNIHRETPMVSFAERLIVVH